jgi:hypothetical protein
LEALYQPTYLLTYLPTCHFPIQVPSQATYLPILHTYLPTSPFSKRSLERSRSRRESARTSKLAPEQRDAYKQRTDKRERDRETEREEKGIREERGKRNQRRRESERRQAGNGVGGEKNVLLICK